MNKSFKFASLIVILSLLSSSCEREERWNSLYNGENLENFDIYLGSSLGGIFDSISQAATPESVFSIVEIDGNQVIRISGEINGSLATMEELENYHLRLVFKWGETVYSRRNSGLLYHSYGDFGVAIGTWMPNIELQLMHQNLGDTYLMANTTCETPVVEIPENTQFRYSADGGLLPFGEQALGRMIRKNRDVEKPLGEWNVVDLYSFGTTAVHVVNGEVVMINYNTGVYEEGLILPLTRGKIQLQSEGAELFIKSLEWRPIKKIPAELMQG
jgi:hypothetical protein